MLLLPSAYVFLARLAWNFDLADGVELGNVRTDCLDRDGVVAVCVLGAKRLHHARMKLVIGFAFGSETVDEIAQRLVRHFVSLGTPCDRRDLSTQRKAIA